MNGLAGAIIGHMVGDYILQTHSMATQKKQNSPVCFLHSSIWALAVCIFAGWTNNLVAIAFLTLAHYVIDRTNVVRWMMSKYQPLFVEPPFAPWSLIVVDNTWHLVQIWIASKFIV